MGKYSSFRTKRRNKLPLIMAHRGVSGGNIPCNTMQAFQAAFNQGADIIELDVACSKDLVPVVHHIGKEEIHLGIKNSISDMDINDIKSIHHLNQDMKLSKYLVVTLEEVLSHFTGDIIFQIDKFWYAPKEISEVIHKLGVQDRVIIKTPPEERYFEQVEMYASDIPYMTVVRGKDSVSDKLLLRENMCYIGAEVLFDSDDDEVASKKYIQEMHSKNLIVAVNAIVYDDNVILASEHTDDVAITGDPYTGWGWFCDQGFDIIQTDFLLACKLYIKNFLSVKN